MQTTKHILGPKAIDLTGQHFGKWEVLSLAGRHPTNKLLQWHCRCDCGTLKIVSGGNLRSNKTRSCGCPPDAGIDLTKEPPFGRLQVIEYAGLTKGGHRTWICRCECGVITGPIDHHSLVKGRSKSCGCLSAELSAKRLTRHGYAGTGRKTEEYNIWCGMIARCHNQNNPNYVKYGARGIRVCDEWRESFEAFLAYVGTRPSPEHSLDRYPNNDGNYEPSNVRWATGTQQRINSRSARMITYQGETLSAMEWAKKLGLSRAAFYSRLSRGWSAERAIETPYGGSR